MRINGMKIIIKTSLIAPLASLTLCFSACAEANSADQTTQSSGAIAESGNWDIQADGSHIRFSAEQEGKTFTGEFQEFSGLIRFDPSNPEAGSVKIEIPLQSVDAGSNDRNSTLPDKVWFSTKKFPTAVFTSTDISSAGDGYLAEGELTLKGTSLPIELPFNLDIEGKKAVMTSVIEMDRTRWGVGAAPWDTDEWVSKTVKLDIQVTATESQ
jgi:polyisoprenoid-binding protein YceI